ncbi:MAG: Flp pilus assembly protein CpaB [Nitrospirota bacterium]|nr:Flp pilus assembly protein CpaB [Nitrospirota bacterium]
MEKYRPMLLLTAAVIVALITSVMAYKWMKKENVAKEAGLQTQPVAVALTDLSWGTALNKEMIKTKPFLKGSLPEGEYFTDAASLEGKVLIMPVKADEPILRSRLAPDSIARGGVAAIVDPKKRAMAVRVDKVIGVSGFVHPGNRVDVLVSLQRPGRESTGITKIVLQNVPVLAAGTEMQQKGKGEQPVQVDVITLELTPEDAEKLAHATAEGKIQLALRNYNSTEEVSTRGATVQTLLSGQHAQAAPAGRRARAPRAVTVAKQDTGFNVEVLKGNEKTVKTFKAE